MQPGLGCVTPEQENLLNLNASPVVIAAAFSLATAAAVPALAQSEGPARNIVLVHGALVDGSGWRAVYDLLVADGYTVGVVQMPLTSLEDDVAATRRVLARMEGPVVLVGHSYGGVVISVAGDDPDVSALVYVAALQPDAGESLGEVSALASPILPDDALVPSEDGFLILDPARFPEIFGADLPSDVTAFMAVSQAPTAGAAFGAEIEAAAWRSKPSFGIVATDDRTVNPELQRLMYARSGATVTEVQASHAVFISQPQAVADVIEAAAGSIE
ncbi:MAG: alpha/beta hydrolase [Rhodobacterales bacterium 12-65-15]|nr:MAG: alpha/beta hydrolase [Rhodobacterales bacterium 12-65-15]